MKFYISGALQGSTDLSIARIVYENAALSVSKSGGTPYVPHTKTDPEQNSDINSGSVFKSDLDEIKKSEALVVFLNEPSLGVGAEIAIAMSMGKKILPLVIEGKAYSRFIEGLLDTSGLKVQTYSDEEEMDFIIQQFVDDCLCSDQSNYLVSSL